MVNIYKYIRRLCIILIRNFRCISNKKLSVSILSAFLSLYTFETAYLDPYICSLASGMLASIGIYGTYESIAKILRQGRRVLKSREPKEPLYLYTQFSKLNHKHFNFLLNIYNENNKK